MDEPLHDQISGRESTPSTNSTQPSGGFITVDWSKLDLSKYILPSSILIAALLISGSLILTRQSSGIDNQNNPGGNPAPAGNTGPVKIANIDNAPYLGNKNAKVTVVEFADFRCPFCERFFKDAEQQIIRDYVNTGKAKFIFKHYAFLGQQSTWASEAAECANEQGKFWEYHDWLYKNQAPESDTTYYSKANLIKYASKVGGLDIAKFSSCLNTDKYVQKVVSDLTDGKNAGVTGTPTVFVNGKILVGAQPYASFKSLIDSELK